MTLPVIMTPQGAQPTAPATLNAELIAQATALSPGLTADLPGALIEDLASTGTGALVVTDGAYVDLINSVTPYGANEFLLNQLGQIYGVQPGVGSNASVYVVFTSDTPGYVIAKGFTVSDGTNQYVVQDGGVIESGGTSEPLFCLAVQTGTFPIPENTVTTIVTSFPGTITLTCNNPTAGLPSSAAQTVESYRAQVIQAGLATAQGLPTFLKTQILAVPGVQERLVSVQAAAGSWNIVVGGGDPYAVAYAIYRGIFDILSLAGSSLLVTGITNANPGVMSTNIPHGFTTGQIINVTGVTGMSGINGTPLTITVIDTISFSIGIDTTSSGAYVSGGVITPNLRNVTADIYDAPDTYTIPFIVPLVQNVGLTFTWNTIATNYVSATAVATLANPAIVSYINSIPTGQPINLFDMQDVFKAAVAPLLDPTLISRMVVAVSIDSVVTAPTAGTGIIPGYAQSYFLTTTAAVNVVQG